MEIKLRIHQIKLNKEPHLINALGLPGKGADGLISDIKIKLAAVNRPLGLSIGGHSLAEYKQTIDIILNQPIPLKQPYFEINISCPNTTTGKSMHDNLAEIEDLITHIRKKQLMSSL